MPYFPPAASAGGGSVVFMEEGSAVGTGTILNFVGAGVTASFSGGTAIATISGGTAGGSGNVVAQTAGDVTIPGLAGSAHRVPASPDADDDEFDTTDTSDPMTGWSTLGSPTAHDINSTALSHYYVDKAAGAISLVGIYKAMSPPFTVTTYIADYVQEQGNARAALFISTASPGKVVSFGIGGANGTIYCDVWTNLTTYGSTYASSTSWPVISWKYFRLVVASSTDVSAQGSIDGKLWVPFGTQNANHSLTVGSVGLLIDPGTSGISRAVFDWIRFT